MVNGAAHGCAALPMPVLSVLRAHPAGAITLCAFAECEWNFTVAFTDFAANRGLMASTAVRTSHLTPPSRLSPRSYLTGNPHERRPGQAVGLPADASESPQRAGLPPRPMPGRGAPWGGGRARRFAASPATVRRAGNRTLGSRKVLASSAALVGGRQIEGKTGCCRPGSARRRRNPPPPPHSRRGSQPRLRRAPSVPPEPAGSPSRPSRQHSTRHRGAAAARRGNCWHLCAQTCG